MLKLTTDKHEASRGLSATADPLVLFAQLCSYFAIGLSCGLVYVTFFVISLCVYCFALFYFLWPFV